MTEFPLNDTEDLKTDLPDMAEKRDTNQLQSDLEKAGKRARRAVGGNGILTDRLYQEREEQVKWELTFPGVHEFKRLVLDDEELSESQYNVKNGVVEVTDGDLKEKLKDEHEYVLRAEYIPEMLAELELDYAEKRIARNSSITTRDENTRSVLEDIQRDIDEKVEQINRLAVAMADPQKGDHAKNQERKNIIL